MQNYGDANLIGMTAHELLSRPNFSARVIAVVSNTVYLALPPLSSTGEGWGGEGIVWLAQSHVPMHPRAILGAFDFSVFRAVETWQATSLQFLDIPVWSPPEIAREHIAPREMVMERVLDLEGFAKPFRSDLRDLIGLGEGLTPSGDDFVGGFLFARFWLHKAYPEVVRWEQLAVDELIEYARMRTNEISFAILRDHARGHSVAPMHDLLIALLASRNKTSNEIQHPVRRLLSIGHTSGKELLAGLLSGILATGN